MTARRELYVIVRLDTKYIYTSVVVRCPAASVLTATEVV